MQLSILHGSGLSKMLDKISSIKKNFDPVEINVINGKETNFSQAILDLSTPSLFSDKRLVILEDFDETIDLNKLSSDENLSLVFKFSKALPLSSELLTTVSKLKGQIFFYSEEKETSIFPFLDYLTDKNPKALLFLEKLRNEYGSQYILTMLFYMFRRLVSIPKNTSTFNLKKIENGKGNFPIDKIVLFYKEIITTDFRIKSGLLNEKQGLTLLTLRILA